MASELPNERHANCGLLLDNPWRLLTLSAAALPAITAGLRPELFDEAGARSLSRTLLVAVLSVLVIVGFGFRTSGLSTEGLSEDELNKLNAVSDYRAQGLTAANGEHPLLVKAMLTGCLT